MASTLADARLERLRKLRELQQELKRRQDEADGAVKRPWREIARPEQLAPPGNWMTWLILAGRGWGKTKTSTEWAAEKARRYPGSRIALVGKTFADVRDTIVEGESGLLACFDRDEFKDHSEDAGYNRSIGEVRLANGSRFKAFSAEKPWRLRGPQHNFAVADEAAFWQDAIKGLVADTTWSNLVITLRLPKKPDWDDEYRPQVVVATTPRPVPLLRTSDPDPSRVGLMQRETSIITRGRTVDNLSNLSDVYKENVVAPLLGTRLGRQELDGELLEDNPGALWKREWIEEMRVTDPSQVPDLVRVVVGVDPAVTDGESSAQTGIIVAGAAKNGRGYVLADCTIRATPMEAMKKVVWAYNEYDADRVVAETNQGGDFIGTLLRTVDPNVPYMQVRATRGKAIRAEPISSLYEQRRICHVGMFPYLEDSMCSWLPTDAESPDRLDACLVAGTLVLTERGDIPVEDVTPGERVWTRQGWKHVLASRCTQRSAEVMTIYLSDGRELTGTADHRVWVEGTGWRRLDALVCDDKLAVWTHQTVTQLSSSSTTRRTDETQIHRTGTTESTTSKMRRLGQVQAFFTAMCGNSSISVRLNQDTTFITQTSTHSTTNPVTCACSHHQSMLRLTQLTQTGTSSFSGLLRLAASTHQNGIAAKKDMSGTSSMLFASGAKTELPLRSSACNVGVHSNPPHTSNLMDVDSAHQSAAASSTRMSTSTRNCSRAKSAVLITGILGTKTAKDAHQRALEYAHTDTETGLVLPRYRAQSAVSNSQFASAKMTERTPALESALAFFEGTPAVRRSSAQYAARNSHVKSKNEPISKPVLVSVVGSSASKKRQPVYDLMVETAHEFLANGIIVHNCVWAITALKDLIGGSFLSAYGVTRCENCRHAFTAKDPGTGQLRASCPRCGTAVTDGGQ